MLTQGICPNILSAIDNALFQVVSILSTTGLSTVNDFLPNASYALIPIVFLMFIGGHSGSTAGGIKASRVALAARSLFYDARDQISPKRVIYPRKINRFGKEETITDSEQSQNYTYILIYMLIGFLGSFGLMLCGNSFRDSFVEFFSALGTVGLSIGISNPEMSNPEMWIIIIGMLIARLEVYIIIFAVARFIADIKELSSGIKYTWAEKRHKSK